jgi:hypothetical protein
MTSYGQTAKEVQSKTLTSTVYAHSALTDTCKQTAVNCGLQALVIFRKWLLGRLSLCESRAGSELWNTRFERDLACTLQLNG